jgi:hypothetical protein
MMTINTAALRDLAAVLRQHGGQAVTRLGYAKGNWQLGRDKLRVNGTQWTARPDWIIRGWMFWWDNRVLAYKIGYAIDGYVPPDRSELGYFDRDQWDVWCKGRDPWQHKLVVAALRSGERRRSCLFDQQHGWAKLPFHPAAKFCRPHRQHPQ